MYCLHGSIGSRARLIMHRGGMVGSGSGMISCRGGAGLVGSGRGGCQGCRGVGELNRVAVLVGGATNSHLEEYKTCM